MEAPVEKPKVPPTPCEENGHFPEPHYDTEEGKVTEMFCRVCKKRMREI